ncbi:MAG: aromatic ring-hydroxylating dioxygenase subunit alpha [Ilumatobacter sp.]|uniref:aromatic ring-hydroxylating dioxygenase subunit alpha n=1 Tax=Ilumatobacter sp. TaxID=1967498 RepID=UPI003299EAC2
MLVSEIPALRSYFHPVARCTDVADDPVRVELFATGVVLWRPTPDGPISAAVDECPHRAARLSQGWLSEPDSDGIRCVVCPYHGWEYAADGACTKIPQNPPDLPIPSRAHLDPVHCEEHYGLVWLALDEPCAPVPDLPAASDPDFELRIEFVEEWDASAPRIVDNSLDIAHVAWVHRGTIGDPGQSELSPFTVERHDHGLTFHLQYHTRLDDVQRRNLGIDDEFATRDTWVDLIQPLVFAARLCYPNGVEHVLFKGATPIDDHRSVFWQLSARNDRPDEERWATIIGMDRAVTNEDRPILEGIRSDFPVTVSDEIHTRSDRMTVEYRRLFGELAGRSDVSPNRRVPLSIV